MIQKFTVQGRLPGYNELKGVHWAKSYKVKKSAMERVMWAAKSFRIQPVTEKVRITVQCFEENNRRDFDNINSGAFKVILDALQQLKIIKGDGQRYVVPIMTVPEIDRDNPRVEIMIESLIFQYTERGMTNGYTSRR